MQHPIARKVKKCEKCSVFAALTRIDHCSVSLLSLACSFLLRKMVIRGSRLMLRVPGAT